MKRTFDERPASPENLHGRLLYTAQFVDDQDITEKSVLNIGCGSGWFELYAITKDVARIVGIEPTVADLAITKKFVVAPQASFVGASGLALPFPNAQFDTVMCWEVLEHLPKGREPDLFSEVRRVLKPGGIFYLSTPHYTRLGTAMDPAYWLIGHRHYYTRKIEELAKDGGFSITDLKVAGRYWEIAALWNLYIAKWVFRRGPFFLEQINRRCDHDFLGEKGFMDIFCRMAASY